MQPVLGPLVTGCSCYEAAVREALCLGALGTMLPGLCYGSEDRYLEQTQQSVSTLIVCSLYIMLNINSQMELIAEPDTPLCSWMR